MSARNRIFWAVILLYVGLVAFALYHSLQDIDPRYRESAEESLVETSALLATLIEQDLQGEQMDPARLTRLFSNLFAQLQQRPVSARIFGVEKTRIDLRCYVTDAKGLLLFDSTGNPPGLDYSQWRDVHLSLRGQYGSRTSAEGPSAAHQSVMYVASPVRSGGRIVGIVSAGKPVSSFEQFVALARHKTLSTGLWAAAASLVLAVLLSVWLVKPFGLIGGIWRHVQQARQQRSFSWRHLGRRTALGLRQSLADIRDTFAGPKALADHVQTLTHEIKSPLSAIRGAAELLQEPLPAAQHARFVTHILQGTQRIQETVDRMMELTALQSRQTLDKPQLLDLCALARSVTDGAQTRAQQQGIHLHWQLGTAAANVMGDAFLLRRAISNLIDNAVDFSPSPGEVSVVVGLAEHDCIQVTVQDQGPGLPDYALHRAFERYYSLPRPRSGLKSTGLGLPFVQAVAKLHGGECALQNQPGGGCKATLTIPQLSLPTP